MCAHEARCKTRPPTEPGAAADCRRRPRAQIGPGPARRVARRGGWRRRVARGPWRGPPRARGTGASAPWVTSEACVTVLAMHADCNHTLKEVALQLELDEVRGAASLPARATGLRHARAAGDAPAEPGADRPRRRLRRARRPDSPAPPRTRRNRSPSSRCPLPFDAHSPPSRVDPAIPPTLGAREASHLLSAGDRTDEAARAAPACGSGSPGSQTANSDVLAVGRR